MIDNFSEKYAFLSNFYPTDGILINIDGQEWVYCDTVEHAFQASKTNIPELRKKIALAKTPGKAKRLGRKVPLKYDWEESKVGIMQQFLMQKFANPELREKLLATGDEELIEGNTWHDNFYGDCHCDKCKDISGKNMLGKLLMQERDRIKKINKGE